MKGRQLYFTGLQKDKKNDNNLRYKIVLPLDTAILSGIVVFLLLILSFSLGTEKGKKIGSFSVEAKEEKPDKPEILTAESSEEKTTDNEKEEEEVQSDISNKSEEIEERTDEYKIQVASYFKENTARQEADKLKEGGYPVSVAKKGKYVVIYVGSFTNKNEAKSNLQLLKKRYKDCILRRL